MKHQAVFFDFDGVILDTFDLKTQAFRDMFASFGPEIQARVVEHHLLHGGISRLEKFRFYYRDILQKPVSENEIRKLGDKFVELTMKGVLTAPFIPGAFEALSELKREEKPAFVVSGIPQEELLGILEKRDLLGFFKEAHGSPRHKPAIIRDILTRKGYNPAECLFLGDATTDYDAAKVCGLKFLGIVKKGKPSLFPPKTMTSERVLLQGAPV
ncbi:HAD family hydrolase [Dethiosulfatarculus sandiegensis]|uniref:phosphoglycolate phosphatase n=1 Tax=Dethiosulfatarculus sandiegensis TaxID=1429043 RepID=A0A0D2JIY6_9BACT|nr:HAD family hydrolase [Dethiosulfatarculus sandiegensis]KIX15646.1 haloacid dehalogenase [Dethiosulfatarculus sandiegensis]